MKNYTFTFFIFLFFQTLLFSQTLCENGMADIYPCNDYDLMSRISTSILAGNVSSPKGSDIWGWTDTNGEEYAIIGMRNSTAFVDISNPINPIYLGRINSANSQTSPWRDIKIYNNHAYIVADGVGNHGMQIFDLTRLRTADSSNLISSADATFNGDNGISIGSCHNIVINESEGIAYLVGCGAASGGPIFVDIETNPIAPTVVGSYPDRGYTHDAQVITYNGPDTDYTGKQIFIGSNGNSNKVVILDVTNKSNVIFINDFDYPQISYAHQGWFTDDQRYFLLGDEVDEQTFGNKTKTLIFDFIDLDADFSNPTLTKTYLGPTDAIDHNGYVNGDLFFLANYRAGMRVLDVPTLISSNNSNAEIGYFDTYPANNNASFNGAWSIYPYFPSGNIIISDVERGLFIVRKSGTLSTETFQATNSFSLSPNPTSGLTTIKSNIKNTIKSISIYNILGQKVFSKDYSIGKQELILPVKNYKSGMYLIKINNTATKKLVVK